MKNSRVVIIIRNHLHPILAFHVKRSYLFEHLSIWTPPLRIIDVFVRIVQSTLSIYLVIFFLEGADFEVVTVTKLFDGCMIMRQQGLRHSLLHEQIYLFYSFSNLEIQNIDKHMTTSPYPHSSQQFYPQYSDRKRTSSLIGQLSSASRQNLQVSTRQNIINANLGFQKINKFASNQPLSEKQSIIDPYGYSQRVQSAQVSKLKAENAALQEQMQRQKQKYQLEIGQLRRNLTLKDELLDECERQIVNLKSTYLKLIDQYEQFKGSGESHRRADKQALDLRQKAGTIPKSPQGNFIPLSLKTKGSASGELRKLSHGLIKGRV